MHARKKKELTEKAVSFSSLALGFKEKGTDRESC